jgi:NTE family protein
MKKFALVLSGGGFKGAFQIGALRHLKKHWSTINPSSPTVSASDSKDGEMRFDIIAGVSVGSLNGVLTACDEFDELEKLWLDIGRNVENIYKSDFIDTRNQGDRVKVKVNFKKVKETFIPNVDLKISLGQGLGMLFSKSKRERFVNDLLDKAEKDFSLHFRKFRSVADNGPLKRRLETLIRMDKVKDCIYRCGFVSLNNGEYYSVRHSDFKTDEDFRNGILASTSMPVVWEPIKKITLAINGLDLTIGQAVDGGIRNVAPLADVIDEINNDDPQHDYTIVIINCNSGTVNPENYEDATIAGIALRSLQDIAITEIFNNDIAEFLRINDIIHQVQSVHRNFDIHNYNVEQGRTTKVLRPFNAIIIQTDPGVLGDALVANEALNIRRIAHGEKKAEDALTAFRQSGTEPRLVIV